MEIFVSGANGFIGSRLVNSLREAGHTIHAAYRQQPINAHENDITIGDLSGQIDWSLYLENIDVIIHCAARVHQMQDSPENDDLYFSINRDATIALAKAAKNASVKRFIFLSTIKVNGEGYENRAIYPDDKPEPSDAYAKSKYQAEQELLKIGKESSMEIVIIRPTLVYGKGVKGNFASIMQLANLPFPLPLNGINNQRSFIGINNLCSLITHCLKEGKAANKILLASDGEPVSTTELIKLLRLINNKPERLFTMPKFAWKLLSTIPFLNKRIQRLTSSLFIDTKHLLDINWQATESMQEQLAK